MPRREMADFLRKRREAVQPGDVGLPPGSRRRTPGLRREEVAGLAGMSSDYYSRLESGNGPQPSDQMLAAIARALRLTGAERDHLFILAGHGVPVKGVQGDRLGPGLMRILQRLADTPAVVLNPLMETLFQTGPHVALEGDQTRFDGPARSAAYRWFTRPGERDLYRPDSRDRHSAILVSQLRSVAATDSRAEALAAALAEDEEFSRLWSGHQIGLAYEDSKHFVHPVVGELELHCQFLLSPGGQHALMVYTAEPGSVSDDRLSRLTSRDDTDHSRPASAVSRDLRDGVPSLG
jgi:transcriptional regulator with XRE-family HTH domain